MLGVSVKLGKILNVICHFHYVDICTDTAKGMVSKTAGALAHIKTVAPNGTSSPM